MGISEVEFLGSDDEASSLALVERLSRCQLQIDLEHQPGSAVRMNPPIAARYASVSSSTGVCELCSSTTSRASFIPPTSVAPIFSVHMS